ncbi:MAG TPA: N-acetyltransferase [Cyanobacteria bacterium UBA8156]|jgi:ribosomal protein S18 acetylase RimI-like enzyme|nr:N-acetyltransferase [Cyanobacteria bacterium UBA8156]
MAELVVRPLTPDDIPDLAALLGRCFYFGPDSWWPAWLFPYVCLSLQLDLRQRGQRPHSVCLVAEQGGHLVGTVELAYRSEPWPWFWGTPPHPYLANLAIAPEYRRLGYAGQLLQRCEDLVRQAGEPTLHLHVLADNEPARRLYARQGFRLVSTAGGWWGPRRLLLCKVLV